MDVYFAVLLPDGDSLVALLGAAGFVAGPATAVADAIVRDRGQVVDQPHWTRAVELAPERTEALAPPPEWLTSRRAEIKTWAGKVRVIPRKGGSHSPRRPRRRPHESGSLLPTAGHPGSQPRPLRHVLHRPRPSGLPNSVISR
jgi:hypothetical protein